MSSHHTMDYQKFRQEGQLSDLTVVVAGETFQLHKFPLYTRSEFFLKEISALGSEQTIFLPTFPGGAAIFSMVADFCYNIDINIKLENVVLLRCASAVLKMDGAENLYDKTTQFLQTCLNGVKQGKDISRALVILSSSHQAKESDQFQAVFSLCLDALIYHWNKCLYGTQSVAEITNPEHQSILFSMPFDLFVQFLQGCKEHLENIDIVNILISDYIIFILQSRQGQDLKHGENGTATEGEEHDAVGDRREDVPTPLLALDTETLNRIQVVLGKLNPNSLTATARKWLRPLLVACAKSNGNTQIIGSIAASLANQMDADCLAAMTEESLVQFVERVDADNLSDLVLSLIVDDVHRRSDADELAVSTYLKLMETLQISRVPNHDKLLHIVGKLNLKEPLESLLSTVDMRKCTVKGMHAAVELGGYPADQIALAAITMCSLLQERLETAYKLIQEQEKDILALAMPNTNAAYHSSISRPPSVFHSPASPSVHVSVPRNSESPTANLGRVVDGLWSDPPTPPNLADSNTKLSELLRKSRRK